MAKPKKKSGGGKTERSLKPKTTNGWVIFQRERRPQIKLDNPQAKYKDIGGIVATEWRSMDPAKKEEYKKRAVMKNAEMRAAFDSESKRNEESQKPANVKNTKVVSVKTKAVTKVEESDTSETSEGESEESEESENGSGSETKTCDRKARAGAAARSESKSGEVDLAEIDNLVDEAFASDGD